MASKLISECIFCRIVRGEIPSFKLIETECSYSFLDTNPLAHGHALIVPKQHGAKLHNIDDEFLSDTVIIAKRIAKAIGCESYNILQNNGRIAHQLVDHVHFHVIPKPDDNQGLTIGWPQQTITPEKLKEIHDEIKSKL